MTVENSCPCGSLKSFSNCCGRFLGGAEKAKTPEQLMRSRYTAHALGGYGEYLVSTWLSAVELGLTAAAFGEHNVDWKKLEVLSASQKGDDGEVEFRAYYQPAGNDTLLIHHEHSLFKRINGVWYYTEALGK